MATTTIEFEVPRWRIAVARAVIHVACVVALISPTVAIAIGERAAVFASKGLRQARPRPWPPAPPPTAHPAPKDERACEHAGLDHYPLGCCDPWGVTCFASRSPAESGRTPAEMIEEEHRTRGRCASPSCEHAALRPH